MPNNVVREQQLQSVASAAKDFALANANILNSVPATVNGGLWYELENDTPVIKLYYGGHSHSLTPTLDTINPNLTITEPPSFSDTATLQLSVSYLGNGTVSVSSNNPNVTANYNSSSRILTVPFVNGAGSFTITVSLSASTGYSAATATYSSYFGTLSSTSDEEEELHTFSFLLNDDSVAWTDNEDNTYTLELPEDFAAVDIEVVDAPLDLTVSAVDADDNPYEDIYYDGGHITLENFDSTIYESPGITLTVEAEGYQTATINVFYIPS